MSIELKIKAKHLALEPAIIRKEEQKLKKQIRWMKEHQQPTEDIERKRNSLYLHRVKNVRDEARATHLARAYIAGKSYMSVEKTCKDFEKVLSLSGRITSMVSKYGNDPVYKWEDNKMKDLNIKIIDWLSKE